MLVETQTHKGHTDSVYRLVQVFSLRVSTDYLRLLGKVTPLFAPFCNLSMRSCANMVSSRKTPEECDLPGPLVMFTPINVHKDDKRDLEEKGQGAKEALGRDLRRLALC